MSSVLLLPNSDDEPDDDSADDDVSAEDDDSDYDFGFFLMESVSTYPGWRLQPDLYW